MAGMDLVSDEGFRIDGRRPNELRRIQCKMGVYSQADGSAYIEQGNTKVLATIYGPHEVMLSENTYVLLVSAAELTTIPTPFNRPRNINYSTQSLVQNGMNYHPNGSIITSDPIRRVLLLLMVPDLTQWDHNRSQSNTKRLYAISTSPLRLIQHIFTKQPSLQHILHYLSPIHSKCDLPIPTTPAISLFNTLLVPSVTSFLVISPYHLNLDCPTHCHVR